MSWFKKKDSPSIPPVNEPARLSASTGASVRRDPSPGPTSRSYNPSPSFANNDPYGRYQGTNNAGTQFTTPSGNSIGPSGPAPLRERYHRNNPVGDPYSHGRGGNLDQDRAELFSGYDPEKHKPSGKFTDGPSARDFPENMAPGADEDDEVEGIKKQTRALKQDSASATRNALRIAREAEETARNTLTRLGDQSEKLANTERHLDVSKGYVNRVEDKQDELKKLNRSIFIPAVTFNKDKKRLAQENKLFRRHEEEREEQEKAMRDIRESQNRIGQAQGYAGDNDDEEGISRGSGSGRFKTAEALAKRKDARQRFQFEATASDDELEDEIDDNLDEVGDTAKRLKALSTAMGQELDNQNRRLERLDNKTTNLDDKLHLGIRRFERFS
ncbi:hypothetical protein Clacol_003885 [Clathrus columnatus]|uniref:t-SNARE coiled-coil homology domain-containing protein n=1 Tax=Clathrus columnatus TaxID=1419009 RepID=A0AAV5A4T9_9AGAM|nr:hypothetical protein Clacol_003885 [Clathrus columnatus]